MPDRIAAGRRPLGVAAAGIVLVAAGSAWWSHAAHPEPAPPQAPAAGASLARPALVASGPGAPLGLRIPALAVASRVVAVRAPGGVLVPPSDPQQLGWWIGSRRPGTAHGSTVITGHTVHEGGGALDHLSALRPGDLVAVVTARGGFRYRVRNVATYAKGDLAARARHLFGHSGPPRLVVVTCSDWNGVRYVSNTVVTASLTTSRPG